MQLVRDVAEADENDLIGQELDDEWLNELENLENKAYGTKNKSLATSKLPASTQKSTGNQDNKTINKLTTTSTIKPSNTASKGWKSGFFSSNSKQQPKIIKSPETPIINDIKSVKFNENDIIEKLPEKANEPIPVKPMQNLAFNDKIIERFP